MAVSSLKALGSERASLPVDGATSAENAGPKGNLSLLEFAGIMVILLMLNTTLLQEVVGGGQNTAVVRSVYMASYLFGGWLLALHYRTLARLATRAPLLLLLVTLPILSAFWSVDAVETLERLVAMVGPSLLGIYLGSRLSLRTLILLLAIVYLLTGLLSLFVIFFVPTIGITTVDEWFGAWRGVHGHKNGLGAAAAFGSLTLLFAVAASRGVWRTVFSLGLGIQGFLLINSESLTSQVAFVVALATIAGRFRRHYPRTRLVLVSGTICLITFGVLVVHEFGMGPLLQPLGRSGTLTNRLPLWNEVVEVIPQRLWLGYGYAAFWTSGLPEVSHIAINMRFLPSYSHNGLLELLLDGGLVLVVIALMVHSSALVRAIRIASMPNIETAYPLALLVGFTIANVTEGLFLARNSLLWTQYVAVTVCLYRLVRIKTPLNLTKEAR